MARFTEKGKRKTRPTELRRWSMPNYGRLKMSPPPPGGEPASGKQSQEPAGGRKRVAGRPLANPDHLHAHVAFCPNPLRRHDRPSGFQAQREACPVAEGEPEGPRRWRRAPVRYACSPSKGTIWQGNPATTRRASSRVIPVSTDLVTTSERLTADSIDPGKRSITFSPPGSLNSRARRAEASRTALLTRRFLATLTEQFVHQAHAGLDVSGTEFLGLLDRFVGV